MADARPGPARQVLVVLRDGVQLLDVAGPLDVLDAANRLLGRPAYRVRTASPGGRDVRTGSGLVVRADTDLDTVRGPFDTLLVPGAFDLTGAPPSDTDVAPVRRLAARSRRTASVCAGALTLAAAGLLDDRRATTHWAVARAAARAYPATRWEPDRIVVADGPVVTSAGVTAGIDLALALVEADHGLVVARDAARWLVVFLRRPGGQAQFRTRVPLPALPEGALRRVVDAVLDAPQADHRLETLADRAAMSPRHLARCFRAEVGTSPARFVEAVRVETVRDALERGSTVDAAARRAGFASAEVMRRAFLRVVGTSPADYRARFTVLAGAAS
jgi:transcriptional regulator GlxA family with amidase domain